MQRPGCFVAVMVVLLVGAAWVANALNPSPRTVASSSVDGQQSIAAVVDASASATALPTSTPNALLTTAALTRATADGAASMVAATATQAVIDDSRARTATVAVWTQRAVDAQQTLDVAALTEVAARVEVLALTLTAAPARQTEDARQLIDSVWATRTQAVIVATQQAREHYYADLSAEAWGWVQVALPIAVIAALIVAMIVGGSALSWRIQGESGGKAEASVVAASGREPIPTTTGGQPAAPLDPHTRTERLALRVLGRMAGLSGDDSATLTSAPEFGDNRSRDKVAAALCAAGLAESVNGVGVQLLDGWTIGELAEAIAGGSITLDDPPAPANVG